MLSSSNRPKEPGGFASCACRLRAAAIAASSSENAGITADTSVEDACEMLIAQFPSLQVSGLTGELAWAATGEVTKTPAVYVVKDGIYAKVD